MTSDVERCPFCGEIYSVSDIEDRDIEIEFDYKKDEWIEFRWHLCPRCGEPIEDESVIIDGRDKPTDLRPEPMSLKEEKFWEDLRVLLDMRNEEELWESEY